ncbi:MAG TPA: glucokinase [Candidatus Binataceae bacterium]|nr:glucokinase [Candidatus Binataceae bacterium]
MILAGDIGGTNARLALFECERGKLKEIVGETFPSRQFKTLEEIVAKFASNHPAKIEHACFGIAGPVRDGRSETPNLAWVVDSRSLAKAAGLASLRLINDLEANAFGVATLSEKDFTVLNAGAPDAAGNQAVISAGTGLGEAGLYWDGKYHRAFASEGGHCDFAPRDDVEGELAKWLHQQFGHASWERVLSGPGLFNIYKFLRDTGRGKEASWFGEESKHTDPSVLISRAAIDNRDPLCAQALDLFVSFYAAEAGNLALKIMALGGVFLGGGIAPRIAVKLKQPAFMKSFAAKGRMSSMLEAIPVSIILNDLTALQGAARCAALAGGLA